MKKSILFSFLLTTVLATQAMETNKEQTIAPATPAKNIAKIAIKVITTTTHSNLYYDFPGGNPRLTPTPISPTHTCLFSSSRDNVFNSK